MILFTQGDTARLTPLRFALGWCVEAPSGRQLSSEGTTVGSQGRKPLDNGISEQQSPSGAVDYGKNGMGAAANPPDPRGCVSANLGLLPLRVFCRPSWGLAVRPFAFQGLTPLATNLGSSGAVRPAGARLAWVGSAIGRQVIQVGAARPREASIVKREAG